MCVRARVCERACALVCVSVRARARVCKRVPLSEQGERNVGAVCVRACVYITAISLAQERSVPQLRVIFVMVSVLFKTTKEGLVSKGC